MRSRRRAAATSSPAAATPPRRSRTSTSSRSSPSAASTSPSRCCSRCSARPSWSASSGRPSASRSWCRAASQNLGELGILFVRDQILRPQLGKKGDRFLPFLVALFFFVWIMNIMGIIPIAQFPATSKIAFPLGPDADGLGHLHVRSASSTRARSATSRTWRSRPARRGGSCRCSSPIELLSNIFVRPFTLTIRLFANMFAGHLLLLVFTLATWYLFSATIGLLFAATSFIMAISLTGFEVLIQAAAGLHLHHADRLLHRGRAGGSALNRRSLNRLIRARRKCRRPEKGTDTCIRWHTVLAARLPPPPSHR